MKWSGNDHPQIASEWIIERPEPGIFFARSEVATKVLRGYIIAELVPRLDGERSVNQLVFELRQIPRKKIIAALESLEAENLVTRRTEDKMLKAESAYWRLTRADASLVERRKMQAACSVTALDGEGLATIEETLACAGITVADNARFRLIVARDAMDPRLGAINQDCIRNDVNWMLVRPYGRRHWIGPLFVLRQTPCWECFSWWLRINGWSVAHFVAEWPVQTRATLALSAIEAARWLLTGRSDSLVGRVREFDTESLVLTEHRVLPCPNCAKCSRCATQEVTLDATLSPITGVTARVKSMRQWSGLAICAGETSQQVGVDGSGRVYYCSPHDTFGVAELSSLAETICLAEGIERYSARFGGFERLVTATHRDLGGQAVHPAELTLESEPPTQSGDEIISWVPAVSLISSTTRFVPAGLVYLAFDERFRTDTNGCASAKTLDMATLSALLELIERDAVALWWYNRVRRPRVDLANLQSKRIKSVLEAVQDCDMSVEVLDLTTDFEIPVCVAVATRGLAGVALGMAAHPDPEQCVWKALAEMSVGVSRLSSPPDGRHHWLQESRIEDFAHLTPSNHDTMWLSKPGPNAASLLPMLLNRARMLNLDVLQLNLTRPELQIPVVRLFVPGLRPLARRLGPGRLYEIPVKLGWLTRQLTPDQMNPMTFSP